MKKTATKLSALRNELLQCDKKLLTVLKKRFSITKKIGELKRKEKMEVIQSNFWKKSSEKRVKWATKEKLNREMVKAIFNEIHHYSLQQQKTKAKKTNSN